ncbi:methionine synthase [Caldanaerobacter subterraneus subsp. yonseiensis KB-1]|uniref:Methionine synthase n=1 Tax=Caldanaerobacter subterraneus subsp. yonseiensis KB-1 TaxID=1388761 RepID=U5CYH2_CALSX|nr:cobalamin-dependent protein [Caldanaerobacter subterraneus]ERM93037.1 methionine synthase [Caldanaerobacter subterraneus subsp. yonseiensis KB-1]
MRKLIVAGSIGNCVHVAGVYNFLRFAEQQGYETVFLGPAVPIDKLIEAVKEYQPEIVGVSYRLTPQALENLLKELKDKIEKNNLKGVKWVFGGTEPTAEVARKSGIFSAVFDGTKGDEETINFLRGKTATSQKRVFADTLIGRIEDKFPYPIIRHHFGLPSLEDTIEGVKRIAEAEVLDVISIAPDQNAQEHFFDKKYDPALDGAGGVPIRKEEDLIRIYEASRRGNYPLLRCYSGTNDVFKMAEMLLRTIKNAWAAIPLSWYNVLDGRGPRDVRTSIRENQQLMKWHAERGVPVEVNEAHHWSLRDAHDVIGVVTAFLAAYNAKKMGVRDYVAQFMFNVPASISPKMDLAKMLAKIELIEDLEDENFRVIRQARAGLASFPSDLLEAKGQLASSAYLSMAIKPHIYHVVGYCEAHHAATPEDIIESVKIVKAVIKNTMFGMPDLTKDEDVIKRKEQLKKEARILLEAIKEIAPHSEDPWSDPDVLATAIEIGLLDAPHLKGNKYAKGALQTKVIDGACYAYDYEKHRIIPEEERVEKILREYKKAGFLV